MKKNYYAIIPADVRYDRNLRPNAKLLYGEITALSNEKGYCWAQNTYFAELYEVSKETISRWIRELAEAGYIQTDFVYKKGTKAIEKRYIRIIQEPIDEKVNTPRRKGQEGHDEKVNHPIDEKVKDNNTSTNTTSNTISNKDIVEIVTYLNDVAKKNYRYTTRKTRSLIKARMNEGFTVDDFKKVIDIKHAEWKDAPKMKRYIRPVTLFGTKFESYLNQETPRKATTDTSQYDDLF